ncbi:MAG: cohesin domain-containing protein [Candidatus Paceibacterota bacterium]
MYKNFTIKFIIFSFLLSVFTNSVFAADISIKSDSSDIKIGDIYKVSILLDTKSESVNTIEGDVSYDKDMMDVVFIDTSASFVNLWVEKPSVSAPGRIHFSGMTPGGVSVPAGVVFDMVFKAKKIGSSTVSLSNISLYINDGLGSKAQSNFDNFTVVVGEGDSTRGVFDLFDSDKVSPEIFTIERTRDESIFDGKYFIAFNAIDKDSGISKTRSCEFMSCRDVVSPTLLSNQTPFYFIKVIAFDMNGNTTSSFLIADIVYVAFFSFIIFIFGLFLFYKSKKL